MSLARAMVALAVAILMGGAAPGVSAWTNVQTTGSPGPYVMGDKVSCDDQTGICWTPKPIVHCYYQGSYTLVLQKMTIRRPLKVFGNYAKPGLVRWRFRVYYNGNLFDTSTWQKGLASKTQKASFGNRNWQAPSGPGGLMVPYTVTIEIQWFTPKGTMHGSVNGTVDNYVAATDQIAPNNLDACYKRI